MAREFDKKNVQVGPNYATCDTLDGAWEVYDRRSFRAKNERLTYPGSKSQ